MRADRLVAVLLLLQARGSITAAEVAAELEISERTARRDLEALAMGGVPVYSRAGRGGGWSLVGGARTDLTGLTAAETRALFLVAGPSSGATPEVRAALRKLVQALPEPFRARARAASDAVVVDPVAWGGWAPRPLAHLDALRQAVVDGVQVVLGYRRPGNEPTERVVHPLGLVDKGSTWYLVAGTDKGVRTFRVSRVTAVAATADAVERPDDFDLDEVWRGIEAEVSARRAPYRVRALVEEGALYPLMGTFAEDLEVGETQPDGRTAVVIRTISPVIAAVRLAGFGTGVEVCEPAEVRAHLVRIATELAERYPGVEAAPSPW